MAFTATLHGRPDIAAHMFGAVEALRESASIPMPLAYQHLYEQALVGSRAALGDRVFEARRAEGRALTMEQALDEAIAAAT